MATPLQLDLLIVQVNLLNTLSQKPIPLHPSAYPPSLHRPVAACPLTFSAVLVDLKNKSEPSSPEQPSWEAHTLTLPAEKATPSRFQLGRPRPHASSWEGHALTPPHPPSPGCFPACSLCQATFCCCYPAAQDEDVRKCSSNPAISGISVCVTFSPTASLPSGMT